MSDELQNKHALDIELAVVRNELKNLKEIITDLKESNIEKSEKLENVETKIEVAIDNVVNLVAEKYVTKLEWNPVKQIVFGLVGIILIAALGALLSLIITKKIN